MSENELSDGEESNTLGDIESNDEDRNGASNIGSNIATQETSPEVVKSSPDKVKFVGVLSHEAE